MLLIGAVETSIRGAGCPRQDLHVPRPENLPATSAWSSQEFSAKQRHFRRIGRLLRPGSAVEPDDLRGAAEPEWDRVTQAGRDMQQTGFDALEPGCNADARIHTQGVERAKERQTDLATVGVAREDQVGTLRVRF